MFEGTISKEIVYNLLRVSLDETKMSSKIVKKMN